MLAPLKLSGSARTSRSAAVGRVASCLLLAQAWIAIDPATSIAAEDISPRTQGHTDRVAFEAWLHGLAAEQREGADFWAAERSKPNPASCRRGPVGQNFITGCQQAQQRLAVPDVRRKTEPDYRAGWNAPLTDAAPTQVPNQVQRQTGWQDLQISSRHGQVVSKAIGLTAAQILSDYPTADCSGSKYCEFDKHRSPRPYCSNVGPCDDLVLYMSEKRVIGYSADFDVLDWSRSLDTSIKLYGTPKKQKTTPTRLVRMSNEYWSWTVGDGMELTYTAVSGVNAYGVPLNAHNISLAPQDLAPYPRSMELPRSSLAA